MFGLTETILSLSLVAAIFYDCHKEKQIWAAVSYWLLFILFVGITFAISKSGGYGFLFYVALTPFIIAFFILIGKRHE